MGPREGIDPVAEDWMLRSCVHRRGRMHRAPGAALQQSGCQGVEMRRSALHKNPGGPGSAGWQMDRAHIVLLAAGARIETCRGCSRRCSRGAVPRRPRLLF